MRSQKPLLILAVTCGIAAGMPLDAQQNDSQAPQSQSSSSGWRRFGDHPSQPADQPGPGYDQQSPEAYDQQGPPQNAQQPPPQYDRQPQPYAQQPPAQYGPPPQLVIPAGTWINIRVNQPVSTDHNLAGDAFSGTLVQPVVVDGFVVARRGQMISGRVAEADRGGRVKGTSRLGLEITEISLADGRQVAIASQMIVRSAGTSTGRDAAAIGTSAGVGAAIGAIADGGFGAGMGALAGAAASTIGVMTTRGQSSVVYPETVLTFRIERPVVVNTERSPHAFQPVSQQDYGQTNLNSRAGGPPQRAAGPYSGGGYYPPYPYYASPFYAPYYGPSFFFYSGRGYGRGRRW
jgi:hypothetical protein